MKFILLYPVIITALAKGDTIRKEVLEQSQGYIDEEPEPCKTVSQQYPDISDWSFNPRNVPTKDTACLSLHMFCKMDFLQNFNISADMLYRFILQVQNNYQDVPYHNWSHGFSVLHFTFTVLKNCKLIDREHLTPLEGLALMTSAMCHDIDHPGTNNKFQKEVNSTLAELYGDEGSILERHHIAVTLELLSRPEINFVTNLDDAEYEHFKELMKKIILATDLAVHFTLLEEETKMSVEGFDKNSERDRQLLQCVVISCADFSDLTRDWVTALRNAKLYYTEFFAQEEKEKQLLGIISPTKISDKQKAKIPQQQIDFISHIVIPNFQLLLSLYPETQIIVDNVKNNLENWWKTIPFFEEETSQGKDQLEIIQDSRLDNIYNWSKLQCLQSGCSY